MTIKSSNLRILNPIERMDEKILGIERLVEILDQTLPKKYKLSEHFESDGPRACFIYDWGGSKSTRFVKIDKPIDMITNPRARRHAQRGLATANDIDMLLDLPVDEALRNGIAPLLDFFQTDYEGEKINISVEPYLQNYTTFRNFIEQRKKEGKKLKLEEFEKIFTGVTGSANYLINDKKIFHRDISYKNLMIDKTLDTMLTDLSSAARVGDSLTLENNMTMTTGSRWFMDTKLYSSFNAKPNVYDARSEIHSIGINMVYSILQELPFDTDPETGKVTFTFTGESLLDKNGMIDEDKYANAVRTIKNKIPGKFRKYSDLIERAITRDESKRFRSYGEFVECFTNITKYNQPSRINKWAVPMFIAGGLILESLMATGVTFGLKYADDALLNGPRLEKELAQERKHKVLTQFDESRQEITNNFANIRVSFLYNRKDYPKIYPQNVAFLRVNPGEDLTGYVDMELGAIPDSVSTSVRVSGLAYIEGMSGGEYLDAWPIKPGTQYDQGMPGNFINFKIPKDVKDQVLNAVIEFWAPDSNREYASKDPFRHINFPKPGTIIARKKIPVVIGDVKFPTAFTESMIETGLYQERLNFSVYSDTAKYVSVPNDINYIAAIPQLGVWKGFEPTKYNSNISSIAPPIDNERKNGPLLVMPIATVIDGNIASFSAIPIQRQEYRTGSDYFIWRMAIPDSSYHTKLAEMREQMEHVKDTLSFKNQTR